MRLQRAKKNPESKIFDPGYPFFIHKMEKHRHNCHHAAITFMYVQAGLLTRESSYRLRLPGLMASGILQLSSSLTAAGPSLILTGFPIMLNDERLFNSGSRLKGKKDIVKQKMKGVTVAGDASEG